MQAVMPMLRPMSIRLLAWGGALLVLAGVAAAYFSPEMVVDLANKVWSCF